MTRTADDSRRHRGFLAWGSRRRFVLLLAVIPAWSLILSTRMLLALQGEAVYRRCLDAAGFDPAAPWDVAFLRLSIEVGRYSHCYPETVSHAVRPALWWTAAVLIVALINYRIGPLWARRTAFGAVPAPMRATLDALVEIAGLASRPPNFVVAVFDRSKDAVTIRRARRPTICLGAGLVKEGLVRSRQSRQERGRDTFRAVVLHELAHVHNRDIMIGYGARALWLTFVLGVVLPTATVHLWLSTGLAATGAYSHHWPNGAVRPLHEFIFVGALVVTGHLIYAGLQRTREQVADHDARVWGADPAVWAELERSTDAPAQFRRAGRLSFLRRPGAGTRRALELFAEVVIRLWTRLAESWQTHPMSARRCRWLAESGFIDANHGKILPSFLAVGACVLTATGMNRVWPGIEGVPRIVMITAVVLTLAILFSLSDGISKGKTHQWRHSAARDDSDISDLPNLVDPGHLELPWRHRDEDDGWWP
ncbi:M48 family metalloprotease [Nocardia beijingensis]|uniref:M48 family metalloprotease n=1 Tax=Nocardia beijingensis TaxID=95162 RepID=UPI001892DF2A|nr:M48 family metalloprotease [Nocardia beijingensis]MBF6468410.1 M48 family metalloprotease [Nocardia beijingensis]